MAHLLYFLVSSFYWSFDGVADGFGVEHWANRASNRAGNHCMLDIFLTSFLAAIWIVDACWYYFTIIWNHSKLKRRELGRLNGSEVGLARA